MRVGGALCALAAARLYEVPGGAGHAQRAGGPGAEGARAALRRLAVQGVADGDGVDPRHVVHLVPHLSAGGRGEGRVRESESESESERELERVNKLALLNLAPPRPD